MRRRSQSRLRADLAWAAALPVGRFEGYFRLEWVGPEEFLHVPDPRRPFRFIRASGEIVQPDAMITDGGTIALLAQLATRITRWSYGPAFLVHDWLWEERRRGGDASRAAFERSNMILAEAMMTMQAAGLINRGPTDIATVYRAVSSPVGWRRWKRLHA